MILLFSSQGPVSLAGPVANIALGAPTGAIVGFVAGPVANIAIGAPNGGLSADFLRDPLGVVLGASRTSVSMRGPNAVTLSTSRRTELL